MIWKVLMACTASWFGCLPLHRWPCSAWPCPASVGPALGPCTILGNTALMCSCICLLVAARQPATVLSMHDLFAKCPISLGTTLFNHSLVQVNQLHQPQRLLSTPLSSCLDCVECMSWLLGVKLSWLLVCMRRNQSAVLSTDQRLSQLPRVATLGLFSEAASLRTVMVVGLNASHAT